MRILYGIYYCISKITSYLFGFRIGNKSLIRLPLSIKGGSNISIGSNCFIGKNSRIYCYKYLPLLCGNVEIGDNFNAQRNMYISSLEKITIGNNVLVGSDVMIIDNDHVVKPGIVGFFGFITEPVIIEDNVWIAEKACILKGITVGKYSIIGASSVVTKNVPPYSMAVGNPARVIKKYNMSTKAWELIG